MRENLKQQIKTDLTELCVKISDRHPGSAGNKQATDYFSRRLTEAGLETVQVELDCLDWEAGEIILKVGEQSLQAFVGPYSKPCRIKSPFMAVSTLEELVSTDFTDKILVLHGELCKEQLAAKNFVFYNPEAHQRIIALLEEKKPLAVLAVTGCNPETTGALCPFPLIEDGDFDIPSVYLSEAEGDKILNQPAEEIELRMESKRIPAKAYNVIGLKKGRTDEKIVFCAHIDTKKGTPGAIDNTGGIALLLSLADSMKDYQGKYSIEILAINGEDYYAYPGGMRYLADQQAHFGQIRLLVNSDGVGSSGSRTSYCSFNADEIILQCLGQAFQDQQKFIPTEPWYQSDHAMFAMHGVTAAALTTEDFSRIWATVAHTAKDTIEMLDANILADTIDAFKQLIGEVNTRV